MEYPKEDSIKILNEGGFVVLPTDTIYGIVASALKKQSVEELYEIRKRDRSKPFIVLISDISQLDLFGIQWKKYEKILSHYWPGPVSIIIPCQSKEFSYLHRGTCGIAVRLPNNDSLRALIRLTGPLVAPSANTEGSLPAETVGEARDYFGTHVSLYVDGGTIKGSPSTLLSIENDGTIRKVR